MKPGRLFCPYFRSDRGRHGRWAMEGGAIEGGCLGSGGIYSKRTDRERVTIKTRRAYATYSGVRSSSQINIVHRLVKSILTRYNVYVSL